MHEHSLPSYCPPHCPIPPPAPLYRPSNCPLPLLSPSTAALPSLPQPSPPCSPPLLPLYRPTHCRLPPPGPPITLSLLLPHSTTLPTSRSLSESSTSRRSMASGSGTAPGGRADGSCSAGARFSVASPSAFDSLGAGPTEASGDGPTCWLTGRAEPVTQVDIKACSGSPFSPVPSTCCCDTLASLKCDVARGLA